jgi:ABC-type multidrug transport system fused ATPase/permease subunit
VDVGTEDAIVAALERLMSGRTTFIIAHRLSTLRHCDRIYAVEAGKLVPSGIVEGGRMLGATRAIPVAAAG